jgi:glutathione S-transferase
MLKILGRNNSSNVQKVMWAVGELAIPHERVDVGGAFGGNKEPAYLAMNPNGLVPTMIDDGFVLWESNAIVRYLAGKHGAGKLEPADARASALANQWMDWQVSTVGGAILGAFWGLIRTPPEKRDHAAIKESQQKTATVLKMFDDWLAKNAYAAGAAFSMGDIPLGIMGYRFYQLVPEHPPLPNLKRWYDAIAARPAFQKHVGSVKLT